MTFREFVKQHLDDLIFKGIPGAMLLLLAALVAVIVRS